jgi:hypothetical protein
MKKLLIALVDDWELRGNGLGHVYELQYKPAMELMRLYEKMDVKASFNVEVMQQLAFLRHSKHDKIHKQSNLWKEAVKIMQERGFDVQLHIHPQWNNAELINNFWKLDSKWNIASYNQSEISSFVSTSIEYLSSIVTNNSLVSFRGGSWCVCCPSGPLLNELEKNGIILDISLVNGLKCDGANITLDYRNLESPYSPYYPDYNDIRKISKVKRKIVEIPTQAVLKKEVGITKRKALQLFKGFIKVREKLFEINKKKIIIPDFVSTNPRGEKSEAPYIIDFGGKNSFGFWKTIIDITIERAISNQKEIGCIVYECHTKDLKHKFQFDNIKRIIKHIREKYAGIVEFVTLSDIVKNIDLIKPKLKNDER